MSSAKRVTEDELQDLHARLRACGDDRDAGAAVLKEFWERVERLACSIARERLPSLARDERDEITAIAREAALHAFTEYEPAQDGLLLFHTADTVDTWARRVARDRARYMLYEDLEISSYDVEEEARLLFGSLLRFADERLITWADFTLIMMQVLCLNPRTGRPDRHRAIHISGLALKTYDRRLARAKEAVRAVAAGEFMPRSAEERSLGRSALGAWLAAWIGAQWLRRAPLEDVLDALMLPTTETPLVDPDAFLEQAEACGGIALPGIDYPAEREMEDGAAQ